MKGKKQVWLADYQCGKWSGGLAVIIARSYEEALSLLEKEHDPFDWVVRKEPEASLRPGVGAKVGMVDSGSYSE